MTDEPMMLYFGPWDEAGHYWFTEHGRRPRLNSLDRLPWNQFEPDGGLQPAGKQNEGEALLHHKGGWTALAFWDRSVDSRGNSCSTYVAEGTFTLEQMVEMAQARFSERWGKMTFAVKARK